MRIFKDKKNCSGCTACLHACPNSSIVMAADEQGFLYPKVNESSCTKCGACVAVCPFKDSRPNDKIDISDQLVYALKHRDQGIRYASTSGGAFSAISAHFLEMGGVVYGAAFNEALQVLHVRCTTTSERDSLRGSKYVQSVLGNTFSYIREDLESGRQVLFTGTPCQVAGLYAYLGKDYQKLFCCDLVCHGVPSQLLFKEYLAYVEGKGRSKVTGIEFRNKSRGWTEFSFVIHTENGETSVRFNDDPYCYLFSLNIMLRPACYTCKFANMHRVADITMGDFWGIEKSNPGFKDDMGVSLVLANTSKGRAVLRLIGDTILAIGSSRTDCLQPNLVMPTPRHPRADKFWADYARKGFSYVIYHYTLQNPLVKIHQDFCLWLGKAWFFPYLKRVKGLLVGGSA